MHFATLPDARAAQDPRGPAIADGTQSLTNDELLHHVRGASRHLKDLGVRPGDVVALKLTNRVEFVTLLFAAWRLGATITPVNPILTFAEVGRQLDDSHARLLVVEDADVADHEVTTLSVSDLNQALGWEDLPPQPDSTDLALIIYTSGTTGVPKGVALDHADLAAVAEMGRQSLDVGPDDRSLLILPLFHANGIVVSILMPLLAGASAVIAPRFHPTTFFDLVEAERPTFFSAVPAIYSMLTSLPDEVEPDTSSVRFAICGAAPASGQLLHEFDRRFGVPVIEGFGLSEGTCGSTIKPITGPPPRR